MSEHNQGFQPVSILKFRSIRYTFTRIPGEPSGLLSLSMGRSVLPLRFARETLKSWGITVSLKRIERLTYQFSKWGLSIRSSRLFHLRQGTLATTPVLKDQRVVISVDGGRTRIRYAKKGKRRQKTNRHGYAGKWQEPKLLTIYV